MNYELAKKLKDAGFPQKNHTKLEVGEYTTGVDFTNSSGTGLTTCYVPTLSELIEACGEGFVYLDRNGELGYDNSWEACGKYWCCEEHGEGRKFNYGPEPDIAVANLWLEINKHVPSNNSN